jgi:hypothetical protein
MLLDYNLRILLQAAENYELANSSFIERGRIVKWSCLKEMCHEFIPFLATEGSKSHGLSLSWRIAKTDIFAQGNLIALKYLNYLS